MVATLTIELEMPNQGLKFEGEAPAGSGETIETAWVEIFGEPPNDVKADVILWAGTDESTVYCLNPQIVTLQQV